MKVLALISGGKDSAFAAMECQRMGHELVALGNLMPADKSIEELDSYMYQTAGHAVVAAWADCTGLPLFRRRLRGTPMSLGRVYVPLAGDEVEDLVALMAAAATACPGLNAVCCGAIDSDFQRDRVEAAAARVGLTSLAPLWRCPQATLVRRLIRRGVVAIIAKVAALGLSPSHHLGLPLSTLVPHLTRLAAAYGVSPAGEGGEYETLVMDCPLFTRGSIVLDAACPPGTGGDGCAGVLRVTAWRVVPKPGASIMPPGAVVDVGDDDPLLPVDGARTAVMSPTPPPHPSTMWLWWCRTVSAWRHHHPMWDRLSAWWHRLMRQPAAPHHAPPVATHPRWEVCPAGSSTSALACMAAWPRSFAVDTPRVPADAATEVTSALAALTTALDAVGCTWCDALFVHLYLADMADWAAANGAYGATVPRAAPPARACVQSGVLPRGAKLAVDVIYRPRGPPGVSAVGRAIGDVNGQHVTAMTSLRSLGRRVMAVFSQSPRPRGCPMPPSGVAPPSGWGGRRVCHVQSISPWAPACIGPYSQGVVWSRPWAAGGNLIGATDGGGRGAAIEQVSSDAPLPPGGRLVMLAGQLALIPMSMSLASGGAPGESLRAAHSVSSVLDALCAAEARGGDGCDVGDAGSLTLVSAWTVYVAMAEGLGVRDASIAAVAAGGVIADAAAGRRPWGNDGDQGDGDDAGDAADAADAAAAAAVDAHTRFGLCPSGAALAATAGNGDTMDVPASRAGVGGSPCVDPPLVVYCTVPALPRGATVELEAIAWLPEPGRRGMMRHAGHTGVPGATSWCHTPVVWRAIAQPGTFCRALASWDAPVVDTPPAAVGAVIAALGLGLQSALDAAGLTWAAGAVVRLYVTPSGLKMARAGAGCDADGRSRGDGNTAAWAHLESVAARHLSCGGMHGGIPSCLGLPRPVLVPVLAVGMDAAALESAFLVEVTAVV